MARAPSVQRSPTSTGLPSPFAHHERIRAVLFDLDGTLYRQQRMRLLMAAELFTLAIRNPLAAPRRLRGLSEYRKAQEWLRHRSTNGINSSAASDQLEMAARRAGLSSAELKSLTTEWMLTRPLKYLPFCRAGGLIALLDFLETRQVHLGVLSDYPAVAKLRALGLANRFPLVLCSTDPDIGAFKPNPRGFLAACHRWGLRPREVLVVGDRPDVDAAGAAAAGMPCIIIGKRSSSLLNGTERMALTSFERLRSVLDDGR
jgi:putative hydrolase of the HAD superfamily